MIKIIVGHIPKQKLKEYSGTDKKTKCKEYSWTLEYIVLYLICNNIVYIFIIYITVKY